MATHRKQLGQFMTAPISAEPNSIAEASTCGRRAEPCQRVRQEQVGEGGSGAASPGVCASRLHQHSSIVYLLKKQKIKV